MEKNPTVLNKAFQYKHKKLTKECYLLKNENNRNLSLPMSNYYMLNKTTELSISISNIFIIKQQSVVPHSIKKKMDRNGQDILKLFNIQIYIPVHKTLERTVLRFNIFKTKQISCLHPDHMLQFQVSLQKSKIRNKNNKENDCLLPNTYMIHTDQSIDT